MIYHCENTYNETIAQISENDDARVLTEVSRAIIPPLMFSLIVSALVVMVYHVVPGVRRHPNFLIYIKAWADLFWCVFTAIPAVALAAGIRTPQGKRSPVCGVVSRITRAGTPT